MSGQVPIEKVLKRMDDIKAFLRSEAELPEAAQAPTARFHMMLGNHLGELNKRFLRRSKGEQQ